MRQCGDLPQSCSDLRTAARGQGGGRVLTIKNMASLSLRNLKKVYGENVIAVHDFNLEIADKEFVVLVGPSGCGKSTTLRMIAGLEEISDGELYIGDRLVNDVPPKDRDIAMVFQNYALYPHMTVYENMAFGLKLRKRPKAEIDQKVRAAAEILGITEYLERTPKALSGGQRQRVAIGRAIVRDPQVFLMDEPLSNLDAKLRNQMRAEIIKLRQRLNTTFVYVTHDQIEAMTLGDRIVIMKDGVIQQVGTPSEVFDHPKNHFVAGFIGTPQMNFFPAHLMRDQGSYYALIDGNRIELSQSKIDVLKRKNVPEKKIILGIRPEHTNIAHEPQPNTIPATVDVSEMMGSELYLHTDVLDIDAVLRLQIIDLPQAYRAGYPFGMQVHIVIDGELCHLFDEETKENLID